MFRRREESFLKGVSVYMRPVEKGKSDGQVLRDMKTTKVTEECAGDREN